MERILLKFSACACPQGDSFAEDLSDIKTTFGKLDNSVS